MGVTSKPLHLMQSFMKLFLSEHAYTSRFCSNEFHKLVIHFLRKHFLFKACCLITAEKIREC